MVKLCCPDVCSQLFGGLIYYHERVKTMTVHGTNDGGQTITRSDNTLV